jgi:hypothetical protein
MSAKLRESIVARTPEKILNFLRVRRRSDAFRAAGVAFVHVPRTGGTSVTDVLFGQFIGHFSLIDLLDAAPKDVRALPRFAITRNPWDRLVSAWAFAKAGSGIDGRVRISQPEQYAVPAFDSFERFVHEWLTPRSTSPLDGIFRPQHSYLLDRHGKLDFSHCGRLEQLDKTQEWLASISRKSSDFGNKNATQRFDYRPYYNAETRDIVARIYSRDIEVLGYDF